MMELNYVLMNPTGNITILVETAVPIEEQPTCAQTLMKLEPTAEQVGFVSPPLDENCDIVLRMAGGEFCGNAAMCTAVWYVQNNKLQDGVIRVRVSGADDPVNVTVYPENEGVFCCDVEMPHPYGITQFHGIPLVQMPGISHLIITNPMTKTEADRTIRAYCEELNVDGLGIMLLEERTRTLTPLVYVPRADTLFWENSCASGTSAVGAWLAWRAGCGIHQSFIEPGGVIAVSAWPEGRIVLHGKVSEDYKKK